MLCQPSRPRGKHVRAAKGIPENHPLRDPEWLREQYWEKEQNTVEIAAQFGVDHTAVLSWMIRNGIERRSTSEIQAVPADHPLQDAEWLHEQYWENEKPSPEIASELDVSASTVRRYMREHDIERRDMSAVGGIPEDHPLRDAEWLREQYCEKEQNTVEIAAQFDVDPNTVSSWMSRHGIELRDRSAAHGIPEDHPLRDAEWVREQYCEKERTTIEIAAQFDVDPNTVSSWMSRHGIERRSTEEYQSPPIDHPLRDPEWLREQYCENEKSSKEIASELGVSQWTVQKYMREHGIELRDRSAAHGIPEDHPLRDAEWVREQYCEKERTTIEIAPLIARRRQYYLTYIR